MNPIQLFDANSWVRMCIEADATGLPLRSLVFNIQNTTDTSIFVWDGKGGNDRRRALFPAYKMQRKPTGENIWAAMNMFKDLLKHTKAIQVTIPGYEGDDVIAALVETFAPQTSIQILSTDRDLFALCNHPSVSHARVVTPKVPAVLLRVYKATVGDPSDNIPGIKGFGEGAWIQCNQDRLADWYERGLTYAADQEPAPVAEWFNMPLRCASWLLENQDLARTMYQIIGFMPPTKAELNAGLSVGTDDPAAVEAIFTRFLQ
jgi:5'-3' exonuclease